MQTEDKNAASSFKAVLFGMSGVLMHYYNVNGYNNLIAKVQSDPQTRREWNEYVIGLKSFDEVKHLFSEILPEAVKSKNMESVVLNEHVQIDKTIQKIIPRLRANNILLGVVTNNGYWSQLKQCTSILVDLEFYFDVVIESCRVGFRKPDLRIYLMASGRLNVTPEECIFIDDSAENCQSAKRLGIETLQIVDNQTRPAIERLEEILGLKLLSSSRVNEKNDNECSKIVQKLKGHTTIQKLKVKTAATVENGAGIKIIVKPENVIIAKVKTNNNNNNNAQSRQPSNNNDVVHHSISNRPTTTKLHRKKKKIIVVPKNPTTIYVRDNKDEVCGAKISTYTWTRSY